MLQTRERVEWDWLTFSRARVLRELAEGHTEREAAEHLGLAYDGVRSIVEDLKNKPVCATLGSWGAGGAPAPPNGSPGAPNKAASGRKGTGGRVIGVRKVGDGRERVCATVRGDTF
mgnify:CR=1 FL=1